MKKPSAIVLLAIISIHFAACTIYANALVLSQSDNIEGVSSNEFMQFEEKDVMQVFIDVVNLDFTPENKAFKCRNNSAHYYTQLISLSNELITNGPLYLSTHSLRI
jgi:hypothetical protein